MRVHAMKPSPSAAALSTAAAHRDGDFALMGAGSEGQSWEGGVSGELAVMPLRPPTPADLRRGDAVVPLQPRAEQRERLLKRDTAALRVGVNILEKWGVGGERAATLLGIPRRTWYQWCRNLEAQGLREPLSPSVLERLSYVLGIWKAALILLPTETAAIRFMQTPNSADTFAGRTPLERMFDGRVTDLAATRQWLDGWRGG